MRVARVLAVVIAASLGTSATASAQPGLPATGSAAGGGESGSTRPRTIPSAPRTTTVKAELRYYIIDDIRGVEPDGFTLTIGLKKYF